MLEPLLRASKLSGFPSVQNWVREEEVWAEEHNEIKTAQQFADFDISMRALEDRLHVAYGIPFSSTRAA